MADNCIEQYISVNSQPQNNWSRLKTGSVTSCTSHELTTSAQTVFDQNSTVSSAGSYQAALHHPNDWDNLSAYSVEREVGSVNHAPISVIHEEPFDSGDERVENNCLQNSSPPMANPIGMFLDLLDGQCILFKYQQ